MNIFVEGLQGSGKSTLVTKLVSKMPGYRAFREGDLSPVELAWCSYMTEVEFQEVLEKYSWVKEEILAKTRVEEGHYITAYTQILAEDKRFYEEMEGHEIYNGRVPYDTFRNIIYKRYEALAASGNIFECSLLQNSIESMMLFYEMSDEEILEFYRGAYEILKLKQFKLIYLDSTKIRENLLQIRKERCDQNGNELWYPLMLSYLTQSPYGKSHNYQNMDDMIAHFERRRTLELRIIEEVIGGDTIILPAKAYELDTLISQLQQ